MKNRRYAVIAFLMISFLFVSGFCVTISEGTDEEQECFIIETSVATYYYQKAAGAFSSIRDLSGIDWVDYNRKNGDDASSQRRGCPSLNYADSIGHPGFNSCTSAQLNDSSIVTTSKDSLWQWIWKFSECHASMKMVRVKPGARYSFMYQGPPADHYNSSNYWGAEQLGFLPDKPAIGIDTTGRWQAAYFGDTTTRCIFYAFQNTQDSLADRFQWVNGKNNDGMARFGFGRDRNDNPLLTGTDMIFTIGFLYQSVTDTATHHQAVQLLHDLFDSVSQSGVYGVSVTAHWEGEGQSVRGGWGDIVRHDIENNTVASHTVLYEGEAVYPKMNCEGTRIAFLIRNASKKGATVAVMDINGNNVRKFDATIWHDDTIPRFIDWPQGEWIYYSGGTTKSQIWRVHAENGSVEKILNFVDTDQKDIHPWMWSFSNDGRRMIFRANFLIYFCNVPQNFPTTIVVDPQGTEYVSPGKVVGCQHSLSPSGKYICYGPASDKHATIRIKQWWDTSYFGCIKNEHYSKLHQWKPDQYHAGDYFNNNHWANNSDEWVLAHESGKLGTWEVANMVLYNWRTHTQIVVTTNTGEEPHFDCPGDFHIDTSSLYHMPMMTIDSTAFICHADSAMTDPADRYVTVSNCSEGVLPDVSPSVHYTDSGSTGWLTVWKSGGSGNQQILTNKISIKGLSGGIYRAIVTISAPGVAVAKIYSVQLTVNAKRVFSSVGLSPEAVTLRPGDSCTFSAVALDQYGDTLHKQPSSWIWKTDSTASIHNGIFTSTEESDEPHTITATATLDSITKTGTARATVEFPALTIISPNGGQIYKHGDSLLIFWTAHDTAKISRIALDLSIDNGKSWYTLNEKAISPHDPQWGFFQWFIPFKLPDGTVLGSDSCKIKVRDYEYPLYRDVSDSIFTIKTSSNINDKTGTQRPLGIFQRGSNLLLVSIPPVSHYSVEIVTTKGQKVITHKGGGEAVYTFSRQNLGASGIYIVRVQADTKRLVKRVLLCY